MEITETTEISIRDSSDGKRNAYNLHCAVVEHYRNYAVCQHLCKQRKEGRLSELYADCSVAIGKKRCPALAMIKEEKEAKKSIYFTERIKNLGEAFTEKAREFITPSKPTVPKSTPKHSSSVIDQIDTGDYAAAINISAAKVETKQGESLLDLARRMINQ